MGLLLADAAGYIHAHSDTGWPPIADRNHDGNQAGLYVWADTFAKSLKLCRTLGVDDTLPTALMRKPTALMSKPAALMSKPTTL